MNPDLWYYDIYDICDVFDMLNIKYLSYVCNMFAIYDTSDIFERGVKQRSDWL